MDDVAREAGVAWITVSRALRDPESVAETTRSKIEAAVASVGYIPHGAARALSSQRSRLVVAIVPAVNNAVYAETLRGLADALRARGMQLMIGNNDHRPEEEERLITGLLAHRPDGLVLTGTTRTAATRRLLVSADIPVVETWSASRQAAIDMRVGFHNRAAQAELARHLVERGYRRIAYITAPLPHRDRWRERLDGVRAALDEAGLSLPPERLFSLPGAVESGMEVVQRIRRQRMTVDALLCAGDVYAIGALLACIREQVKVPGELAIAGFGDFGLGALLTPALTTIRVPSYDIGRVAGQMILDRLDGHGTETTAIDLGYQLIVRQST